MTIESTYDDHLITDALCRIEGRELLVCNKNGYYYKFSYHDGGVYDAE